MFEMSDFILFYFFLFFNRYVFIFFNFSIQKSGLYKNTKYTTEY